MGQRQNKDEIEYGNDCSAGWDIGKTPKFVYARFSLIEKCPDPMIIPPNDRVFKLTQEEYAPCDWLYEGSIWRVVWMVAADPAFVWLILTDHNTGVSYFQETPAGTPCENHIYHNENPGCDDFHGGIDGIATVTWGLESLRIRGLLNIETQKDLFMEMRPLADGNKVYKYCNLKDATNVAILFVPGEEYRVTGILTPDGTGSYHKHVLHNGKMSYRRTDGLYFLWWDAATTWVINTGLDVLFPPAWRRVDPDIIGAYQPIGDWLGVATVAEL